jgi:hypothetical protein
LPFAGFEKHEKPHKNRHPGEDRSPEVVDPGGAFLEATKDDIEQFERARSLIESAERITAPVTVLF